MKSKVWTLALAGGALALPSCGMFSTQNKGLAQVDDLVGCIERVYVDSELARDKSAAAMVALRDLTAPDFHGDAVLGHAQLVEAIDGAEKQAKDLRFSVDRMKRAAGPVFSRWARDIEAMQTPELKQRSQARFDETKQRYQAIVGSADPTLVAYDAFNRSLRDHALFLGHDFNAGSVAALADDVRKLQNDGGTLVAAFQVCMQTTRAYVDSAALPMRVEAARPAPR